jgi:Fic family protein
MIAALALDTNDKNHRELLGFYGRGGYYMSLAYRAYRPISTQTLKKNSLLSSQEVGPFGLSSCCNVRMEKAPPLPGYLDLESLASRLGEPSGELYDAFYRWPSRISRAAGDWSVAAILAKEAVAASQIAGYRGTLEGLYCALGAVEQARYEPAHEAHRFAIAFEYAQAELAKQGELNLAILQGAHQRLHRRPGSRQRGKNPFRTSPADLGTMRRAYTHCNPPPAKELRSALEELQKWWGPKHGPNVVQVGIAHARWLQLRPFASGNFRTALLLAMLLFQTWQGQEWPVLCLATIFAENWDDYCRCLGAVSADGNWEGWLKFWLESLHNAAQLSVKILEELAAILHDRRHRLLSDEKVGIAAVRLEFLLPNYPIITTPAVARLLDVTLPTATAAIESLCRLKILTETTGRRRGRVFADLEFLMHLGSGSK